MLVALGAAAFIVAGLEIIESMAGQAQVQFDPMRVVQGIAGGVGFLGAGAIIQSGGKVRGLTTAAGMWTCAAMGLAAGAGLYRTALMVTLLCVAILTIVQWVEPAMKTGDPKPNDPGDADPGQDRQQ
jgi:putative Mg2+ transporter-C (MgtC) family protein